MVIHNHIEKKVLKAYHNRRKFAEENPVDNFLKQINEAPLYICTVCHRSFYHRSVIKFNEDKYELDVSSLSIKSYDTKEYICNTCHTKLKKNQIPCQAVSNKLHIDNLPLEFSDIKKLERVLVSKRILFKKIVIMHGKGEFSKIKGSICNVPIDSDDVCNILPRGADSNGLVIVKLKRQLKYKGHVHFQPIRKNMVLRFLAYLKENNDLYKDIRIDESNLNCESYHDLVLPTNQYQSTDVNARSLDESVVNESIKQIVSNIDNPIPIIVEECDAKDEVPIDPTEKFKLSASEMTLISDIPNAFEDENLVVAPGEGKTPISLLSDEFCEELSHPHLFPTGKFGYRVQRKIPLTPVKYFNQRLLNYTQKFASDSDYIFFARSVLQQVSLQNSISIALSKVKATSLTAGTLNK